MNWPKIITRIYMQQKSAALLMSWTLIPSSPSLTMTKNASRGVSKAEIKSMEGMNALRPDGFPPCFFQKNWDIVGAAVVNFVKKAFANGEFPDHMNESLIALIRKQDNSEMMSLFQSIAPCNVMAKLITKIVANRLKPLMGKLVGPNQASFIPGRQASDNMIIVQEILHSMKKRKEENERWPSKWTWERHMLGQLELLGKNPFGSRI